MSQLVPAGALEPFRRAAQEWELCISFGPSTSKNYTKAVALAKSAPRYLETHDERGTLIHQAFYSADPDEFLKACALYELVGTWKSCFVFINGEMVDRKEFGGVKWCYGDKCRARDPNWCYGASQFTENPFGCHRAQMHAYHDPWWSFAELGPDGYFHVPKARIASELLRRLIPYRHCPALDVRTILTNVMKLPDRIDLRDEQWVVTEGPNGPRVQPKSHGLIGMVRISIGEQESRQGIAAGEQPAHLPSDAVGVVVEAVRKIIAAFRRG